MKALYSMLAILLLNSANALCQVPSNDSTWVLKFSEDFTSNNNMSWTETKNYLNQNGWHFGWRPDADWISTFNKNPQYAYYFTQDGSNMKMSDGTLKIQLKKNDTPYRVRFDSTYIDNNTGQEKTVKVAKFFPYTTGHLHMHGWKSWEIDTDYGYYEMKYKLNTPTINSQGVQTNYWLFGAHDSVTYCEIDIFEINGLGKWYTHNFHHDTKDLPFKTHNLTNFDDMQNLGLKPQDFHYYKQKDIDIYADSNGFHTIGCEVTPNKMIFYQDNKVVRSIEISHNARLSNLSVMQMELNNILPTGFYHGPNASRYPNASTTFPNTFEIDYIRFYKLKCDDQLRPNITPNSFPNNMFSGQVVKSVNLGTSDAGVPNALSNGDQMVIRSNEAIILNDGFSVDKTSGFYGTNCDCER
jgi:hypothetical protein